MKDSGYRKQAGSSSRKRGSKLQTMNMATSILGSQS